MKMGNTTVLDKDSLPERVELHSNSVDESGHRYGGLTALYPVEGKQCAWWLCRCDCGNYITVRGYSLRQGMTKSCGCKQHEINDITGNRYGHLVVLRFAEMRGHQSYWECACDCGNTVITRGGNLSSNEMKVCRVGCDGRPENVREDERKLKAYIDSANRRSLQFNLAPDEFSFLIHQPCHYCGIEPAGGVDRLNPGMGYTMDNTTSCCSKCNYAKASLCYDEFLEHIERIHNHIRRGGTVLTL